MTLPEKLSYCVVLTCVCYLVYHVLTAYPLY